MDNQKPIEITKENFARFGQYFNLRTSPKVPGQKYAETMTAEKPVYQPMRFGMTMCYNEKSFTIDGMERHKLTDEVLFAADKPIVLSVADSDPDGLPQAKDVVSFILQPGDIVSIGVGIWHDACHAMQDDAFYYFMAHGTGQGDEIIWHNVEPAPLKVEL